MDWEINRRAEIINFPHICLTNKLYRSVGKSWSRTKVKARGDLRTCRLPECSSYTAWVAESKNSTDLRCLSMHNLCPSPSQWLSIQPHRCRAYLSEGRERTEQQLHTSVGRWTLLFKSRQVKETNTTQQLLEKLKKESRVAPTYCWQCSVFNQKVIIVTYTHTQETKQSMETGLFSASPAQWNHFAWEIKAANLNTSKNVLSLSQQTGLSAEKLKLCKEPNENSRD